MKFLALALAVALLFSAGESVSDSLLNKQNKLGRRDGTSTTYPSFFHCDMNLKCLSRRVSQLSQVRLQSAWRTLRALRREL